MNNVWKWFAKIALGRLHEYVDGLTANDRQELVDRLNARIGGNRKIQAVTLNIIIDAIKTLLDIVKL